MSKPPLDDLARIKAQVREEARKNKAFSNEAFLKRFAIASERGAALAAVAYLDNRLGFFLRHGWIEDEDMRDKMLRPDGGPLSSLGAKIRLCRLMGYVSKRTYDDLAKIAKVRNLFAHYLEAETFEFPEIATLCSQLSIFHDRSKFFGDGEDAESQLQFYKDFGYDLDNHRWGFIAAAGYLGNRFQSKRSLPYAVRINSIREFI